MSSLADTERSLPSEFEFFPRGGSESSRLAWIDITRHLAGRRCSGIAKLDGREVFAKCFLDPSRAERDASREIAGFRAMNERGLRTPRLITEGELALSPIAERKTQSQRGRVLIFERRLALAPLDVLAIGNDPALATKEQLTGRRHALEALATTLGQLSAAGVVQTDLHLGNFLFDSAGIQTLDLASLKFEKPPLEEKRRREQWASFLIQIDPGWWPLIPELELRFSEGLGRAIRTDAEIIGLASQQWRARRRRFHRKLLRSSRHAHREECAEGTFIAFGNEPTQIETKTKPDSETTAEPKNPTVAWRELMSEAWSLAPDVIHHEFRGWFGSRRARRAWTQAAQAEVWKLGIVSPAALIEPRARSIPTRLISTSADRQALETAFGNLDSGRRHRLAADLGRSLARFERLGFRFSTLETDALKVTPRRVEVDLVLAAPREVSPFAERGTAPKVRGFDESTQSELERGFSEAQASMRDEASLIRP